MNTLDNYQYGYPLADGYGINTDLALLRADLQSGHKRQRRSYLHNASLITLSFQLTIKQGQALNAWLQAQPGGDFFNCKILSGNNWQATQVIEPIPIRRTSIVTVKRIPGLNTVVLSFEAETQYTDDYQYLADQAANKPPATYPAGLPMPLADGFSSAHEERNRTIYSLSYAMNTETLARWLAFAGYQGTAWFYHPMVSVNVPCGSELLRYISPPQQELTGPNSWLVTVEAESNVGIALLDSFLPPSGACTYDSGVNYDDPLEPYDCGGVTPPQGNFVMPVGVVIITSTASGPAPQTAQAILKLLANGTVAGLDTMAPAWPVWHTAPGTLANPGVALNQVQEISVNQGASWVYYTPSSDGPYISLKNDVWIRLQASGGVSEALTLNTVLAFQANVIPTPFGDLATIQFNASITVSNPTNSVTNGLTFADGYTATLDPGDTVESVSAGLKFFPDGQVIGQSTNTLAGKWYDPLSNGAGTGKWALITKISGNGDSDLQGPIRVSMAGPFDVSVYKAAVGGGSFAQVSWDGTIAVYDSPTGGNLLGTNTINLASEVSP